MFMAAAYYAANEGGLTVDDLHRCVEDAVAHDDGDSERKMLMGLNVPWLASLHEEPRSQRPWLRRLQPLEAAGEA